MNLIDSYNSLQEACDTDCDTFSRPGILGILLLKSPPSTHRNLTTSKKGTKGSIVVSVVAVVLLYSIRKKSNASSRFNLSQDRALFLFFRIATHEPILELSLVLNLADTLQFPIIRCTVKTVFDKSEPTKNKKY